MGRSKKGFKIDGWVNFYKPAGMTSTQAVGAVRRFIKPQKIGHGGTLDPLAEGVLPLALGEATKTVNYCQDHLKTYLFDVCWGEQRNTDDAEGEIIATSDIRPTQIEIENALSDFTGHIMQIPPAFSAIKIDGARAYDLARDGEDVKLKPREVYVETLELVACTDDIATLRMHCGKGTYVRSLARDLAEKLGSCGYVSRLIRESVGPFTAKDAISLEKLEQIDHSPTPDGIILPLETVLDDIPALALSEQEANRLKNGQVLLFISRPDFERLEKAGFDSKQEETALAVYQGKPIALVLVKGAEIKPERVLNL